MSGNKLNFTAKENPSAEEINELRMSLRAFNQEVAGEYERTDLIQQVRNDSGKLVGGVYGTISWDWLYIDLLWVDESQRGTGLGSKLLQMIEQTANEHNVYRYRLSTTSYQALDFYKKMGYEVCGEINDLPPGHINYFLIKTEI